MDLNKNEIEEKNHGHEHEHEHKIIVQVNNRPVTFEVKEATGLQIKQTAIAQQVAIQADFCLFIVKEGRQEPVKDDEVVHLHRGEDFDAVDPDHCS